MSETEPDTKAKGHCPKCGAGINAWIRGEYTHRWSDDVHPLDGSEIGAVLQCCGCETIYFREQIYFSEDVDYDYHPVTGETIITPNLKTTFYPAPTKRAQPEWMLSVYSADEILGRIIDEVYIALNSDLSVLAAIGIRTCIDRMSELLGIDPSKGFEKKLNQMLSDGVIGAAERKILSDLIDAGSAAAHRGWSPAPSELGTMVDILENLLHRNFVIRRDAAKLKATVPPRQTKPTPKSAR